MSGSLLGVSITGLRASQTALSTTGHNISNAGTDGYSRQRVDIVTNPAVNLGGNFIGNGANVDSVDRIANSYVTSQLRIDSSLNADLSAFLNQTSQLDNLLSNEATGLTGGLQTFFAAMQNGSDDPTSVPARQLIVSQAENLADRFNSIDARMQVIDGGVSDALHVAVAQVNSLAKNIAQLNIRIADAQGVTGSSKPNDLLDQRDEALRKLSELIPIQTFNQGQGQVNVVIKGGMSLVLGANTQNISIQTGRSAGGKEDVVIADGASGRVISSDIKGGEIGALIRFRDETLYPAYNSLGRVASVLANSFNETHKKGLTPDNDFGGLFFNDINSDEAASQRVIGASNNALPADRQMSLYIDDMNSVTTSNYKMKVGAGGSFKVLRESDGNEVASGLLTGSYPVDIKFDGLELKLKAGSFAAGDEYALQPFTTGARDFQRIIANTEDIAFASPINTQSEIGNNGSGKISAGSVIALTSASGELLAPFSVAGQMSPPMVIQFTSPTTYDVLDNTDPAHPVQLDPPLRNQRYIPGIENKIFAGVDGQKQITMAGDLVGLPAGRSAVTQATVKPTFINPSDPVTGLSTLDFTTTNFSGANQFSFNVQLTDTVLGAKNTNTQVTVSSANISSEVQLLQHINTQLSMSGVRAYIVVDDVGNRSVGFKAVDAGYGNVVVGGYAGPVNGNADALLNNNIESGAIYTSDNGAFGVEGTGTLSNGYPAESITITKAPSQAGLEGKSYTIMSRLNGSAKDLANELNNIPGVEANAFCYAQISDFNFAKGEPLQITLNGVDLLSYRTDGVTGERLLSQEVPDPIANQAEFNLYLAKAINTNTDFIKSGITAIAGQNIITGKVELRVSASHGDDLKFGFIAKNNQSVSISDGEHNAVNLLGGGNDSPSQVVVGGKMDVRFAADMTLTTRTPNSLLFGDTLAQDFEKPTYLGLAVSITGSPDTGDRFILEFNHSAASDNRNALSLIGIENNRLLNGGTSSMTDAYGTLVETVGITTNAAKVNSEAAAAVLEQTTSLRDSISGVNLDEEAANLIRYEQFFQANAQVISVARDLFDTLLGSF